MGVSALKSGGRGGAPAPPPSATLKMWEWPGDEATDLSSRAWWGLGTRLAESEIWETTQVQTGFANDVIG